MLTPKKKKSKWTVSVSPIVSEAVESYLKKRKKDKLNRSSLVEAALEQWFQTQEEEEEKSYYADHASELNADSKSWSRITTEAAKRTFK